MKRLLSVAAALLLAVPAAASVGSKCDEEARSTCGAGQLPRLTDRDWSAEEIARFRARAAKGTVAVVLAVADAGPKEKPRMLADCRLPGGYTEIATKPGAGRLWATNRPLLVLDEVLPGCAAATHEVVTFAVGATASFAAVLVPLPCPSVNDPSPAAGCVGRGAAGPERRARALAMIKKIKPDVIERADPSHVLTVYALAPDEDRSLTYLSRINSECTLVEQARWVNTQLAIAPGPAGEMVATPRAAGDPARAESPPPRLDVDLSRRSCLHQPAFRKCLPALAEAASGWTGCWDTAKVAAAKPDATMPAAAPPTRTR